MFARLPGSLSPALFPRMAAPCCSRSEKISICINFLFQPLSVHFLQSWAHARTVTIWVNSKYQGWEFAHRFSEGIARFLPKNERFTHSLIFGERPERFAHDRSFPLSDLSESLMVAYFWWATWAIRSHHSFDLREMSDSLTSLTKKEEMSENKIK